MNYFYRQVDKRFETMLLLDTEQYIATRKRA